MSTTTRVQNPTTVRSIMTTEQINMAGTMRALRANMNAEDVNQVTFGVPAPAQPRPTPEGPAATDRPQPTMPGRTSHMSTQQHQSEQLFAPHQAYFSDLEEMAKRNNLDQSRDAIVRRAAAHARQGCKTCQVYLSGLIAGYRGREAEEQQQRTVAKQHAGDAQRRAAMPDTARTAYYHDAETTRRAVEAGRKMVVEEQTAKLADAQRVGQAIAAQPYRQGGLTHTGKRY